MTASKTITIFMVDDNVLYLKSLESAFISKQYYNIKTFPTAERCIEQLDLKPDVIFLDYYLNSVTASAMNGLDALVKIRKINKDVPVIMLTTEEKPEIKKACIENKATEFIIKSDISFARLREILTEVFIDKQTKDDVITHINQALNNMKG